MSRENEQTIITGGNVRREEEKQIMITWPTGHKDGPYTQTDEDFEGDIEVEIGDRTIIVPAGWTEPVKPELEDDRLYRVWDSNTPINKNRFVYLGKDVIIDAWDNVEPLLRRWDDLDIREKNNIRILLQTRIDGLLSYEDVRKIYETIYPICTREQHP